ncbi:MAG: hypothetical protein ACLQPH_13240 [Acidimicrobiales bacterium]
MTMLTPPSVEAERYDEDEDFGRDQDHVGLEGAHPRTDLCAVLAAT